ncbi:hypothetical protein DSCA_62680 [Desulfosarcina alkanivorans]|uniref:Uncharacterized protein n=1 Tax=Desulfosarcina alkanivorans TaxID=571177 RepID=A0A5K7YUK8_9BACT|nr:hypothetical protein DSCA_62680 [Desulfosarcina alkanivorans]
MWDIRCEIGAPTSGIFARDSGFGDWGIEDSTVVVHKGWILVRTKAAESLEPEA